MHIHGFSRSFIPCECGVEHACFMQYCLCSCFICTCLVKVGDCCCVVLNSIEYEVCSSGEREDRADIIVVCKFYLL